MVIRSGAFARQSLGSLPGARCRSFWSMWSRSCACDSTVTSTGCTVTSGHCRHSRAMSAPWKWEPSITASSPSRASFAATACTAGKTASAWLVNPATIPPGERSPVSFHAVCETFPSAGESAGGT